jgi:hypothetical protein
MANSGSPVVNQRRFAGVFVALFGCESHTPPQVIPTNLGQAHRMAAADLDGDGIVEVIRFVDGKVHWRDTSASVSGAVQALVVSDPDGDGQEDVYFATGRGKGHPSANARVMKLSDSGLDQLWVASGGSKRTTDLRVSAKGVYIARFGQNKQIEGGWIIDGQFEPHTRATMAMQQIPLDDGRIVLGRLYGDEPRTHGDLRVRGVDGEDIVLPTLRGVRTLLSADVNGDSHTDLIVADGWHFRYGTDAQAHLMVLLGPDFTDRRELGLIPGEYTFNHLAVVRGDPVRIMAQGPRQLHLFTPHEFGWRHDVIATIREGQTIALWQQAKTAAALISGRPVQAIILPL